MIWIRAIWVGQQFGLPVKVIVRRGIKKSFRRKMSKSARMTYQDLDQDEFDLRVKAKC